MEIETPETRKDIYMHAIVSGSEIIFSAKLPYQEVIQRSNLRWGVKERRPRLVVLFLVVMGELPSMNPSFTRRHKHTQRPRLSMNK